MNQFPRRRKAKKTKKGSQIRCPGHLAWIRGHNCSILGQHYHKPTKNELVNDIHVCSGKIEAAHTRRGTDGGTSLKPSDIWTIPLCSGAHSEQHAIGEESFEKRYGINMKAIAEHLARISPHRMKWIEK